jgi:DNA-binding LacI/PurR family transcriptional regulator
MLPDPARAVSRFGSLAHPQENAVGTFNAGAARRATEHLIRLGHRRIAHVTYAPLHYIGARQRMQGYKASLTAAGIRFNPRLIGFGDYSCESGYLAMTKILRRGAPPSALFAGNDVIAIGAMAALDEAGLAIPQDVAVVGFDNIPMSAYTRPALTTIQVAAVEQGELAAEAALALLQGKKIGSRQDVVPLPLVIRDSCGARLEGSGVRGQEKRNRTANERE